MTQAVYSEWYSIIVFVYSLIFCIVIGLLPQKRRELSKISSFSGGFLLFIALLGIAFCPSGYGSDKSRYEEMFRYAHSVSFAKDIAWQYYTYISSLLLPSAGAFFFVTALFYTGCYWIFAKKYFSGGYISYFLILVIGSMGFYGYGMNTIRAGVALGFVLLAICNREKLLTFLLFSFVAVNFHKSMVLPLGMFIVSYFYKSTKGCLLFWGLMLILSFLNIETVSLLLQNVTGGADERIVGYMSATENELYTKAGFRWDFILYSLFPMGIGCYYVLKKKFEDKFYSQILNTYILVNAFWLIVIRIPYTDRFAYLSWFLAPIIILYPLVKQRLLRSQQGLAIGIILIMISVNFVLNFL